jgi:hypothetical protein
MQEHFFVLFRPRTRLQNPVVFYLNVLDSLFEPLPKVVDLVPKYIQLLLVEEPKARITAAISALTDRQVKCESALAREGLLKAKAREPSRFSPGTSQTLALGAATFNLQLLLASTLNRVIF